MFEILTDTIINLTLWDALRINCVSLFHFYLFYFIQFFFSHSFCLSSLYLFFSISNIIATPDIIGTTIKMYTLTLVNIFFFYSVTFVIGPVRCDWPFNNDAILFAGILFAIHIDITMVKREPYAICSGQTENIQHQRQIMCKFDFCPLFRNVNTFWFELILVFVMLSFANRNEIAHIISATAAWFFRIRPSIWYHFNIPAFSYPKLPTCISVVFIVTAPTNRRIKKLWFDSVKNDHKYDIQITFPHLSYLLMTPHCSNHHINSSFTFYRQRLKCESKSFCLPIFHWSSTHLQQKVALKNRFHAYQTKSVFFRKWWIIFRKLMCT